MKNSTTLKKRHQINHYGRQNYLPRFHFIYHQRVRRRIAIDRLGYYIRLLAAVRRPLLARLNSSAQPVKGCKRVVYTRNGCLDRFCLTKQLERPVEREKAMAMNRCEEGTG